MQTGEVSSAVVSAPSAKVFSLWLGFTSDRESARRDLISIVLQNAGYAVSRPLLSEEGSLVKLWQEAAQQHDAALLIIGADAGPKLNTGASLLRLQYDTLLTQVSPQFRLIVWAPVEDQSPMDLEAQELLSHIENTLTPRVMLTRTRSLPLLIQEIHAFLQEAVEARQAVKLYDIVFIHNIQDAEPFYKLIDDVSAKVPHADVGLSSGECGGGLCGGGAALSGGSAFSVFVCRGGGLGGGFGHPFVEKLWGAFPAYAYFAFRLARACPQPPPLGPST
jgi:hypothetical protein